MRESSIDVAVQGDGPVGCAFALALQGSGLRVAMVAREAAHRPAAFRPIALSYASRLILERIGAWEMLRTTPIEAVHASQLGGFGRVRLDAADCSVPALGYVVDYADLHQSLQARLAAGGIRRISEAPGAACLVHAEGSSESTEKRYAQEAIVANVGFATPSGTTAFERFTPEGPLALLPLQGRYAVIWSTTQNRARELAAANDDRFLAALSSSAGSYIGVPMSVESRSLQPLVLRVRPTRVAARAVYIGNAAQTLHPVAGQGLNLGLRDAWDLAEVMRDSDDPGSPGTLARYGASRRLDAGATIRLTDALAGAFLGTGRISRLARGIALTALDVLPIPRRFFARRMVFGPSALP